MRAQRLPSGASRRGQRTAWTQVLLAKSLGHCAGRSRGPASSGGDQRAQTFRQPANCVKLGGWPAWVQGPDAADRLVAQVPSIDEFEGSLFGDCGTLYLFGERPDGLAAYTQYY